MKYYDEDFYDVPTEFEQQIMEFKSGIAESVKRDFLAKMEALEKENAELREFRDQKDEMERILKNKISEYNRAIRDAESKAKRENLKKYFGENLDTGYRPASVAKKYKKCGRCDDNRSIRYKTPLGKDNSEKCVCAQIAYLWCPKEVKLFSFYASCETPERRKPHLYYELVDPGSDSDRYDMAGDIYDGKPFDEVSKYRVVFLDETECKEYCEWLNNREEENNKKFMETWGLELDGERREHNEL